MHLFSEGTELHGYFNLFITSVSKQEYRRRTRTSLSTTINLSLLSMYIVLFLYRCSFEVSPDESWASKGGDIWKEHQRSPHRRAAHHAVFADSDSGRATQRPYKTGRDGCRALSALPRSYTSSIKPTTMKSSLFALLLVISATLAMPLAPGQGTVYPIQWTSRGADGSCSALRSRQGLAHPCEARSCPDQRRLRVS